MKEFIAQTIPAVNIPSKKIVKYPTSKIWFVNPPKVMERKNPTHVDVHKGHPINSPKNFELRTIQARVPSKMEP